MVKLFSKGLQYIVAVIWRNSSERTKYLREYFDYFDNTDR